jgi:hypothetical protein
MAIWRHERSNDTRQVGALRLQVARELEPGHADGAAKVGRGPTIIARRHSCEAAGHNEEELRPKADESGHVGLFYCAGLAMSMLTHDEAQVRHARGAAACDMAAAAHALRVESLQQL